MYTYKPHFVFAVLNILKNFVNTDIYWERLSLLENLSTRRQPENGKILYNGVSTTQPALSTKVSIPTLSPKEKGLIKLIFIKLQKVDKKWQFLQKPWQNAFLHCAHIHILQPVAERIFGINKNCGEMYEWIL